ncbi:MAG: hypothetical protein CBC63_02250 [Euryarchaeota archaeon TMED103]|jgi:hypothetical protein|nr:MAG: hypothetical protein CBC63_02250 [Euryarchaeota archaeon TMED103]|tara:strand:+ start:186 stop:467 length:282 start_codon:yes stop_codon:yes gene_type:complete
MIKITNVKNLKTVSHLTLEITHNSATNIMRLMHGKIQPSIYKISMAKGQVKDTLDHVKLLKALPHNSPAIKIVGKYRQLNDDFFKNLLEEYQS